MSNLEHSDTTVEGRATDNTSRTLLAIPPNFYTIPLGLAGLAMCWRLAARLFGLPPQIGDVLFLVSAVVFLLFFTTFLTKLVLVPRALVADLTHPVFGPFNSLLPIGGMLLALGLEPYAYDMARVLFLVFFVSTLLLGGWMIGHWIVLDLDADKFSPAYFLPNVAGGLLGADIAASFGLTGLSWMSFGIGMISWATIGSIIFNRLFFRPSLPAAFIPTLAINIAPPVLVGDAYFELTGGRTDPLAYVFAGYAVLMLLVQVYLVPLYLKLKFTPGFWAFTFSYAAAAAFALRWIHLEQRTGLPILGYAVLTIITVLIGGIAIRSLIALRQGTFLPVPPRV
jgi:tellurite resistance protein